MQHTTVELPHNKCVNPNQPSCGIYRLHRPFLNALSVVVLRLIVILHQHDDSSGQSPAVAECLFCDHSLQEPALNMNHIRILCMTLSHESLRSKQCARIPRKTGKITMA